MKDYYKILEIPFGAPSAEIKRAYHKLAFQYHPDKNFGNPVFEEKFKEINEAYTVLSNEYKRIIYHAEYAEYLKGFRREQTIQHRDPAFTYPRRPRGPATEIKVEFKTLKIIVGILFAALIVFMLYQSRGHMTEPPATDENILLLKDSLKSHHMTKAEYYQVISNEYIDTKDSAVLKLNADSMIHIIDSIMNAK